jgi:Tfp pilus assembly protein PilF
MRRPGPEPGRRKIMMLSALLAALVVAGPQAAPAPAPQQPAVTSDALPTANPSAAQADIDQGLQAFRRLRFTQAEASFEKAWSEDPTSAAAAFYLGYTYYKIAEPKRPFHPDKQKAADMFAKAYALDPNFRPVWGQK